MNISCGRQVVFSCPVPIFLSRRLGLWPGSRKVVQVMAIFPFWAVEFLREGLVDLPMRVTGLFSCQVSLRSFRVFKEGSFRLPAVSNQEQSMLPRVQWSPRSTLSETMVKTVPVYKITQKGALLPGCLLHRHQIDAFLDLVICILFF